MHHTGEKWTVLATFLRKFLKRLQRVIVVDGATHSQKDGVEGDGGSLKDGAEAFTYAVPARRLTGFKV